MGSDKTDPHMILRVHSAIINGVRVEWQEINTNARASFLLGILLWRRMNAELDQRENIRTFRLQAKDFLDHEPQHQEDVT